MFGWDDSSSSTVCMVIAFSFEVFSSAYWVTSLLVGTCDWTVVWRLMYLRSNNSSWICRMRTVSLSWFYESCWLRGTSLFWISEWCSSIQVGILCLYDSLIGYARSSPSSKSLNMFQIILIEWSSLSVGRFINYNVSLREPLSSESWRFTSPF